MKLSETQTELLALMQTGETLHFMAYMGRFNPKAYFICGGRRCTKAAEALTAKGLVERYGANHKAEYRLSEEGRKLSNAETPASRALDSPVIGLKGD